MPVPVLIITIGVLLATLVVVFIFFKRWVGFTRTALEDVGHELGSDPSMDMWNVSATVSGSWDGSPVSVRYTCQTRSSPPQVTVRIYVDSAVSFVVRKSNRFDRFCAAIGLAAPLLTGDPGFDEAFYVDTGRREMVRLLLCDGYFREQLAEMFGPDVLRVSCENGFLSLIQKMPPRETVDPEMVFQMLQSLRQLAEGIVPMDVSDIPHRSGTGRSLMRWGLAPGLLLAAGGVFTILGMEVYPPLYPVFLKILCRVLPWGLSAGALYVLWSWIFVRSRTDRHLVILLVFLLALPGCCLGAVGWRYFGNGWLDTSEAVQYEGTVLKTFIKGRGGRKIVFRVYGKETDDFSRPRRKYPKGMPVWLTVRSGYYGTDWVERWTPASAD